MPKYLLGLLMIIINDCSWSNNPYIMIIDKWSIEIYIVQKIILLWLKGIWKWSWLIYLNYEPHHYSKLLRIVNNSWVDITFIKIHWYSPCKRKSLLYVSYEITFISIALLRGTCTYWEWNYLENIRTMKFEISKSEYS